MSDLGNKIVYILVGPKGAGKTHIGALVERAYGVSFLRVEPLILQFMAGSELKGKALEEETFRVEERAIDERLADREALIFETTGSSVFFPEMLERLSSRYLVKLIRVRCPLDVCRERVLKRSGEDHIPVSDERVMQINEIADRAEFDWDREIDNSSKLPDEEILSQLDCLFKGRCLVF